MTLANDNSPLILLTGATGYIGSHTWCELLQAGYQVVGLDNLSNSDVQVVKKVKAITGKSVNFVEGDVRDEKLLDVIFSKYKIDAVIHFAALKSVAESVSMPLEYYYNNIVGQISLCKVMAKYQVKKLVFSSSATVYGQPAFVPIKEDFPVSATNPYGQSKLMGEQILRDLEQSDCEWSIIYLRYFNPAGAHESGLIGEMPQGAPNNLMPYVAQVAVGQRDRLFIYGNDYATVDGTGVRDYIHVLDLAIGHVKALAHIFNGGRSVTVNLGTGNGFSVLQVVSAYQRMSGREIPYEVVGRRAGDIAECYADASLAENILSWKATRDLDAMCLDSWRWQSMGIPRFYDDTAVDNLFS